MNKYSKLLEYILSYFVEIKKDNPYYHDYILFFYKNIINSNNLQMIILTSHFSIIEKIMEIALSDEENNDTKANHTQLIMIKLLAQILNNINKDQTQSLYKCCKLYDNTLTEGENPFIYLYKIINNKLIDISFNREKIIDKYYNELLLICINKLLELYNENSIEQLLNDKSSSLISLLSNNYTGISENNFFIKTLYNLEFENYSLFNSENLDKQIKSGKIICYLNKNNNKSIDNYLSNNEIYYYNKNDFEFYTENRNEINNNDCYVYVIMDDTLESDIFKITSTEIKSFSEVIINERNEKIQNFIKKNAKLIFNRINKEIDSLNDKGIYYTLKIILEVIQYLEKNEIIEILKYILDYYKKIKIKKINIFSVL